MLAYVFWHTSRPGMDASEYELLLTQFHGTLVENRPDGFVGSTVLRQTALPWFPADSTAYEDWYLIDDYASLGALNDAAVEGLRRRPHDEIAGASFWGTGGLYLHQNGSRDPAEGRFAYWFSMPAQWDYDGLYEKIGVPPETGIWRRQMALGPAPEFCLRSETRLELDLPAFHEVAPLTIWSGKAQRS